MRIKEILAEDYDEDEGRIPNPLGAAPDNLGELFDIFGEIESYYTDVTYGKDATREEAIRTMQDIRDKHGKITTMKVSDLTTTEPTVDEEHLNAIINNKERKTSSDLPVAYLFSGKTYLIDGNHRAAAAAATGQPTIKLILVDIVAVEDYAYDLAQDKN